jgi:ferredoxin
MTVSDAHLRRFTAADWSSTLEALAPEMHAVDRDATRIWHAFYPLALADAYAAAADAAALTRRLRIDGNPRLASGQIDSSHAFLYGHRYWPQVKAAVLARLGPAALIDLVRGVAADVAADAGVAASLVTGIAFVGLMTLRQVGGEAFRASTGQSVAATAASGPAPDAVVARRARDDGQGLLGFLRSTRQYRVVFDERQADASFPLLAGQHLTTASANDTRDYTHGPRRFQEGPIPAQCRSATCSTCWVGVLGGRDKVSAIDAYETRRLHEFGYIHVTDERPFIRLACQTRASGNVTIVIPPWHGLVSRLEPASTASSGAGEPR